MTRTGVPGGMICFRRIAALGETRMQPFDALWPSVDDRRCVPWIPITPPNVEVGQPGGRAQLEGVGGDQRR